MASKRLIIVCLAASAAAKGARDGVIEAEPIATAPALPLHPLLDGFPSTSVDGAARSGQPGTANTTAVGYFFRSLNATSETMSLAPGVRSLAGLTHYRLLPGVFPDGMGPHRRGVPRRASRGSPLTQATTSTASPRS